MERETREAVDAVGSGQMSRRAFIRRMSALGISAAGIGSLLAACDPEGSTTPATEAGTSATEAATSTTPSASSGPTADGQVTGDIVLYKGPFSDDEAAQIDGLLAGFKQQQAGVSVTREEFAFEAMAEEFPTKFLSDTPPDVSTIPDLAYGQWVERGAFEDLTPYVTDPSWAEEFAAIPEDVWNIARAADGNIYGIPWWGVVLAMLFVNRDLLKEAGVTDVDSSIEAFEAAVRQVSALGDDTFGFSIRTDQSNPAAFDWASWLHTSGGRLLNDDWTACAVDTPDARQTFQMLSDLISDGASPEPGAYDAQGLQDLFVGGRVGIAHEDNGFVATLREQDPGFEYDVLPVPPGPGGEQATGMWGVGLLTMSSDSQNKPAAWELMKYLASADVVVDYFQQVSLLPNRTDVADRMFADDQYASKVVREILPGSQGWQLHPDLNQILGRAQPVFDTLYRGQTTADQALPEVCTVIDGVI